VNPRLVRTVLIALGVGGAAYAAYRWLKKRPGLRSEFLCDTCSFGSQRDCNMQDFPNATTCGEYRSKLI
jgi:hypothetical protein